MNIAKLGDATDALAFGKDAPKKKGTLHMHLHQMNDKKFHVEHEMRGGSEPSEREEYGAADLKELHKHIDRHFSSANMKSEASKWEEGKPGDREAQPSGDEQPGA